MSHWDVVVAGAGQAGCAAAWDLAAGGARVLLLHSGPERAKPCAGGVTIKALRRYRFPIDAVIRESVEQLMLSRARRGKPTHSEATAPFCVMTHRPELDELCRHQAREAGADWARSRAVRSVHEDGQGVTLVTAEGQTLSADHLIVADGAHSPLRRLLQGHDRALGAMALEAHIPRERINHYPPMTLDFQELSGGYGWLFPKGDHVNLGLYVWRRDQARPAIAILEHYAERALGCRRLINVAGYPLGTWLNQRPVYSGRVLFAGDAAGTTEPLLGEGIYGALLSGQLAAGALLAGRPADYPLLLSTWSRELRQVTRLAQGFYALLPVSYPLLSRWLAPTLLAGYAQGLTLKETAQRWRALRLAVRGPAC